jgi:molybdate transport system substrate-binding protein
MMKTFFACLLLMATCGRGEVTVFAAAGTAPAMKEIASEFTKQTGVRVVFNFANAGVLARQINAGAPFDLFFSANEKWMDCVEEAGAIDSATRIVLLTNELVIIVPKGRPMLVDFSMPCAGQTFAGRFATGDSSTPLGIYAQQAFEKLGWWEPLQGHLCAGDTVNKALNYVALGEADVGVVFRSVATCASNRVDLVATIPAELHTPIRFPIAAAANARGEALQFWAVLQGEPARCIFKKYGWSRFEITP